MYMKQQEYCQQKYDGVERKALILELLTTNRLNKSYKKLIWCLLRVLDNEGIDIKGYYYE